MPKRKGRENGVVTVSDVARRAGVSSMTVSRVVNGRKYVGEETRQRVLAAVNALTPGLSALCFLPRA